MCLEVLLTQTQTYFQFWQHSALSCSLCRVIFFFPLISFAEVWVFSFLGVDMHEKVLSKCNHQI